MLGTRDHASSETHSHALQRFLHRVLRRIWTAPGDAELEPGEELVDGDEDAFEAAEAPSGDGWHAQRSSDCGWQVELDLAHSASGQAPGMQGLVGSPRSLAVHSPASATLQLACRLRSTSLFQDAGKLQLVFSDARLRKQKGYGTGLAQQELRCLSIAMCCIC